MASYRFNIDITLTGQELDAMHFVIDSMTDGGCSAAECFKYDPEVLMAVIGKLFGQVREEYSAISSDNLKKEEFLNPLL